MIYRLSFAFGLLHLLAILYSAPTLGEVRTAAETLAGAITTTPLLQSPEMNARFEERRSRLRRPHGRIGLTLHVVYHPSDVQDDQTVGQRVHVAELGSRYAALFSACGSGWKPYCVWG